jgi:hypothetical protein
MFSHDVVSVPVDKTYEAVMSDYIINSQTMAAPLSTQIIWGSKRTSIS